MSLGLIALLIAAIAGGWLLFRVARAERSDSDRNITLLKGAMLLGLVAVLFAAKLWPLAFMVLFAVGAVMAIEIWRGSQMETEARDAPTPPRTLPAMTSEEALSILGLESDANAEDVRAAHRKLISQIHPDKGGTDYLASKINEARDLLLKQLEDT